MVAALGGLLFGYDTAVISGTTGALDYFFIQPLFGDLQAAANVILEYKMVVSICFVMVAVVFGAFLIKLYGRMKGGIYLAMLLIAGILTWYYQFWTLPGELTENLANSIRGFTISSALIGCIIGGALGGWVALSFGRKNGLVIAAALFTLSAIGSALPDLLNIFGTENITSLIIYRIIGGTGVGLASMLAPMYIAEIAPAAIRGRLVSCNQFAIVFGMLAVYFVNYGIAAYGGSETWINETGWRWMFASETVPCVLFFILLFFVPETPRYLVLKNRADDAEKVLQRICSPEEVAPQKKEIETSLKEKHAPWLSFGGMVILVGILISFFQQAVGINAVLYYAPEIFRNLGSATNASLQQTIIVGAVNLSFTVLAIFTVDKWGRKPLMITGALGMATSMTMLSMSFIFSWTPLISLISMLAYTAFFAVSWGPVAWVLLSEIFPNSIRSALSIAVAAQWFSNLIVSWTFPIMNDNTWLNEHFNRGFAYMIYGAMGILAALFIWKFVPETKGKTLESIESLWKKK